MQDQANHVFTRLTFALRDGLEGFVRNSGCIFVSLSHIKEMVGGSSGADFLFIVSVPLV